MSRKKKEATPTPASPEVGQNTQPAAVEKVRQWARQQMQGADVAAFDSSGFSSSMRIIIPSISHLDLLRLEQTPIHSAADLLILHTELFLTALLKSIRNNMYLQRILATMGLFSLVSCVGVDSKNVSSYRVEKWQIGKEIWEKKTINDSLYDQIWQLPNREYRLYVSIGDVGTYPVDVGEEKIVADLVSAMRRSIDGQISVKKMRRVRYAAQNLNVYEMRFYDPNMFFVARSKDQRLILVGVSWNSRSGDQKFDELIEDVHKLVARFSN